jgi:hypothetical protein
MDAHAFCDGDSRMSPIKLMQPGNLELVLTIYRVVVGTPVRCAMTPLYPDPSTDKLLLRPITDDIFSRLLKVRNAIRYPGTIDSN